MMKVDKTQKALDFIITCCPNIGSFSGTSDVNEYLKEAAQEMEASTPTILFPQRYIEHVAYAVTMISSGAFLSSPAAIASLYLATRFEFYFRILSGKLTTEGTWISPSSQQIARAALSDNRLKKARISSVSLTYKIMKLDQYQKFTQICTILDTSLYTKNASNPTASNITDIGDRIEFSRNAAGHGLWGDISAEGIFYGLMTAILFYNQP